MSRYLLYFHRGNNDITDVHTFTGPEGLSEPRRFTRPDRNIAFDACQKDNETNSGIAFSVYWDDAETEFHL